MILISCFGLGVDYVVMALAPTAFWMWALLALLLPRRAHVAVEAAL